jgi:hypothetical protein
MTTTTSNRSLGLADVQSCKHMLTVVETREDAASVVRMLRELCATEAADRLLPAKLIDLTTDEGYRAFLKNDPSPDQKRPNDDAARLLARVISDLTDGDLKKSNDARAARSTPRARALYDKDGKPAIAVAPIFVEKASETITILAAQSRSANVFLVPILTSELALSEQGFFQKVRANCLHFALAPGAAAPQYGRNFMGDFQVLQNKRSYSGDFEVVQYERNTSGDFQVLVGK